MLTGSIDEEMAFWPFGRKRKKKTESDSPGMGASRNKPLETIRGDPVADLGDIFQPALGRRSSQRDSQRRKRSSSRKLTKARRSRTTDSEKAEPQPPGPVPSLPPLNLRSNEQVELSNVDPGNIGPGQQLSMPPRDRGDVPSYYFQNPTSLSSLQPETFNAVPRIPTLRATRGPNEPGLPRRKSSKRKAEDHARELEIKAMSSLVPIPKRPTSHASGMLARDSKRNPSGLNHNLERPQSEVSLPLPESVHSAMSVASDSHGFKISSFDALSPRPTIHYFENTRNQTGSGSFGPSRTSTKREKQPVILEEAHKSKKRMDDLADDLDAGSLRELMERDRRRSERSRRSEQEKLQRRLQRRADTQHAAEISGGQARDGPSDENADPKRPRITRSTTVPVAQNSSFKPSEQQGTRTPDSWINQSTDGLPLEYPFSDTLLGDFTSQPGSPTHADELDVPVLETAKAVRLSQASMSPPTSPTHQIHGPSSLSQLSDPGSRSTPDIPERVDPDRRDSDNSGRISSNWTAIFRRSATKAKRNSTDRGRRAPSEFSNTSRESFVRQMPPSAFARIPPARSGTPVRTQSRFREDLPELPTPPDSRLQSPEASAQPQSSQLDRASSPESGKAGFLASSIHPLSDIHPAFREEVALSRHQSIKSQSEIPPSAILSQSLASVDSEGSWLTGRPVKRSSQTLVNPLRESGSSLHHRLRELGASEEELRIAEKEREYGGRLSPESEEIFPRQRPRKRQYKPVGPGMSDSEDDATLHSQPAALSEEEGKWHGAVGKQPTIVRQGAQAKSREGLLNEFQAAEDSTDSSPTADSPTGQPFGDNNNTLGRENSFIHRATSIDLAKGHARHISAGSARLLNLPPRSSGEMKRISTASGERSPLVPPLPSEHDEIKASDVD